MVREIDHGGVSFWPVPWRHLIEEHDGFPDRQVTLLDWGNAEVTVVPYGDIIHMIRCQIHGEGPEPEQLNAFLDSYGLNKKELDLLGHVLLLKTFDNLRWAIDQSPDQVNFYVEMAQKVFHMVKESSRD